MEKQQSLINPKFTININFELKIAWMFKNINKKRTLYSMKLLHRGQKVTLKSSEAHLSRVKEILAGKTIFEGVNEFYQPIGVIGEGKNSNILICRLISNQLEYGVKVINKALEGKKCKKEQSEILHEIQMLQQIQCLMTDKKPSQPFYTLHDVFETDQYFFIVLDLLKGKSLQCFIEQNHQLILSAPNSPEYQTYKETVKVIMKQILEAVDLLHTNGFIHQNVSPENLVFRVPNDPRSITLIDFGSTINKAQISARKCFSPDQTEQLTFMNSQLTRRYQNNFDLVDCAYILFTLLTGELRARNYTIQSQTIDLDEEQDLKYLKKKGYDQLGIDLIKKLLERDPSKRVCSREALQHPFFQSILIKNEEEHTVLSKNMLNTSEHHSLEENQNFEIRRFPSTKRMSFIKPNTTQQSQQVYQQACGNQIKSTVSNLNYQSIQYMQSNDVIIITKMKNFLVCIEENMNDGSKL